MGNISQKWVECLIPFTSNYYGKITIKKINEKTKLPQQTISRILNNLVKENILSYEIHGKNKFFFLNKDYLEIILEIAESQKALNFKMNNKNISLIINELKEISESIIIFGSYASNKKDKNSDLDLIIIGKFNSKEINKMKKKYPIEINIHFFTQKDFIKKLKEKNPFLIEIKENHIFFGDISKLINLMKNG